MKKRKLTKDEEKLYKKQLADHRKAMEDNKVRLAYNKDVIDKQEYLRAFEDKWRNHLRDIKNLQDTEVIKAIETGIKDEQEHIRILELHMKDGVEQRENSLVG